MRYQAVICARGGSKGVPRKNLQPVAGVPLIGLAVQQALAVPRLASVVVSTDDTEIAQVAESFGATVPFLRPAELSHDRAPEWLVWQHLLEHFERGPAGRPDALVSVPTTSPLRSPVDIEACLDLWETDAYDVVLCVTPSHRNPWFNMVTIDPAGQASLVNAPSGTISRRQDAPDVYDITTVCYVVRASYLASAGGLFQGRVGAVRVPPERAVDIDTPMDLLIARALASAAAGTELK